MTIYTAASGALVFATGTIEWSLGLDDFPPSQGIVPAMQQVTANFLSRALQAAPPPTLTSVNPNSGGQGQNLNSVILAGNKFQSGATCNFGAGITVNSCVFDSPTQLTANITIGATATLGSRNVAVTNRDSQSSTLSNGFTVTTAGMPPPPALSSVNPNSGARGQNLTGVILSGNSFQSGATCAFGAGITVNSCTFNSPTQLTASIGIGSTAALGSRNVTVTNPDSQSSTLSNAFSVTAISLIQKATFSRQPTSGGTVTLNLAKATGAGNALIVGVSFWPLDISSVTDASGDVFTRGLPTSIFHDVSGSATYTNFYYAKSTAGGATSLTLNFSGGSTYLLVAVAEVAGLDPSAPLDKSGFHDSLTPTAAWSSAAVTTTAANEYLFSWAATQASNPFCSNPASGWTVETQFNDSSGATVCLLDGIVSVTGSYQTSVTASSAQNYVMEIVTFKSGSSSSPPPPTLTSVNPTSGGQGQNLNGVDPHGQQLPERRHLRFWSRHHREFLHLQLGHSTHRQHQHRRHGRPWLSQRHRHQSRRPIRHFVQRLHRDHGWAASSTRIDLGQSQFRRSGPEFEQRHADRQQLPERRNLLLWGRHYRELLHLQLGHATHRQYHHRRHRHRWLSQRHRHQSRQPVRHSVQRLHRHHGWSASAAGLEFCQSQFRRSGPEFELASS